MFFKGIFENILNGLIYWYLRLISSKDNLGIFIWIFFAGQSTLKSGKFWRNLKEQHKGSYENISKGFNCGF